MVNLDMFHTHILKTLKNNNTYIRTCVYINYIYVLSVIFKYFCIRLLN